MGDDTGARRSGPGWWKRVGQGAQNALEMVRGGRFSAPYRAPFDVACETPAARLRHYRAEGATEFTLLLVPPLMVTAEIYDISPELSAVTWLRRAGGDVWVVDFGRPEEEGGMAKTLDDHVLAVDSAVSHVRQASGRDVHLGGYSQGGMFVYQCAAFRRGAGLASLITFGSPVDIHRNLPAVRDDVASRLIRGAREAVARPLEVIEGLPGTLTSAGFRVLSARKEFQQMVELVQVLHDREALEQREKRRRFLLGEGFVAWPGPALRTFIDEFVVNNRMADGGFVIGGRTITLADIELPILCFIGDSDEIARPASVRAIHDAAPRATISECHVPAGHFGLVVGSKSLAITWPTVRAWVLWREARGPMPPALEPLPSDAAEAEDASFEDVELGMEFAYDLVTDLVEGAWGRLGDASQQIGEALDVLRWQLPRVAKLKRLTDDTPVSMGLALADQAAAIPDATFFLWGGRAFTYRQADERVTNVAAGLWSIGVRPGARVGILMSNRPTYLSAVCALSRIGGVAVLLDPEARGAQLRAAIVAAKPDVMLADPEHGLHLRGVWRRPVYVLGGGATRALPKRFVDMESIDVAGFRFPDDAALNAGRGGDLAMLMFTSGTTGLPKAARITNRRWALAALGTAAGCRLTSSDTVYCCLPLHHATAMLVAVGGGLVGGCRIALAPRFSPTGFWDDVRRYGATVVFYVGELCRHLANAPEVPEERRNPVRVFAGTGMRAEVWTQLVQRFQPDRVIEFYASTEGNAVLVNLRGKKVGSVGRPVPGGPELALVRYDAETGMPARAHGRATRVPPHEHGLLLARVVSGDPLTQFDGYSDAASTAQRLARDVFEPGDTWFVSGDLLFADDDGDYFFVDRAGDSYRWRGETVSTELVAGVLAGVPSTEHCVVYGVRLARRDGRAGMAAIQMRDGHVFDGAAYYRAVADNLSVSARPVFLRVVDALTFTASHKLPKAHLAEEGADPLRVSDVYWLNDERRAYVPLDVRAYDTLGG